MRKPEELDALSIDGLGKIFLTSCDQRLLQAIFKHPNCSEAMLYKFFQRTDIDEKILLSDINKNKKEIDEKILLSDINKNKKELERLDFIKELVFYINGSEKNAGGLFHSEINSLKLGFARKLILELRSQPHEPFTKDEIAICDNTDTVLGTICNKSLLLIVHIFPKASEKREGPAAAPRRRHYF